MGRLVGRSLAEDGGWVSDWRVVVVVVVVAVGGGGPCWDSAPYTKSFPLGGRRERRVPLISPGSSK